jgi:hypothetical protein
VSSEYLEGFAADPFEGDRTQEEVERGLTHRRAIFYVKPGYWILCDLVRGREGEVRTLEQLFHVAPVYQPGEPEAFRAGRLTAARQAVVTQDEGLPNLAVLPVDAADLDVRAQKGETTPAVGWYGVLGEFPAWDVTLECERALPARMDAVLYPLAPGVTALPSVRRLAADERVTAFRIEGVGLDDTYILCEEDAGPVSVGDVTFEGRAVLIRRGEARQVFAVQPGSIRIGGERVEAD